jgi:alpha-galactosidase
MRFEPLPAGGHRLSGGLHDWAFSKELAPGAALEGTPLILVSGSDLDAVAQEYARVGRRCWYPRNELSATAPVEWNHWWPYEDVEINEAIFLENVEIAAQMGFEVCTLDSGWFGPSDSSSSWYDYRGDWALVNTRRFPGGIRKLADRVHALDMKFGIWCEIEALGAHARLAQEHAEYVAFRDGERLGYVCFGNPQVQEWAFRTLERLIVAYRADWIKLDFNLDPGAGCNRSDHGHQAGDGLYEHVRGYYRMLDRVHQDYPEVVLENCSSGGLRIDLGILRRTHMTFLSDADYPVHDLQVFWGASTHLAPSVLLHWTFSEWRSPNPPPEQTFDPHDPALTRKKWDYYACIAMLGQYGLSQRLPLLPGWLRQRVIEHNQIYKDQVRRFILNADLYHLTDQPLRDGSGERWAAFQYALPDGSEHLLFVFRLPGAEPQRTICLKNLEPERLYHIHGLEGEEYEQRSGRSLMEEGLLFSTLEEEDSVCLRLTCLTSRRW